MEENVSFAENSQSIAFEFVPHCFMFAASWFEGKWLLGGQCIAVANEVNFGSEVTLWDEFLRLYGAECLE